VAFIHPTLASAGLVAAVLTTAILVSACSKSSGSNPSTPSGPAAPAFTVTFGENPVPFRSTGCNGSVPEGWFTTARIQETAGVSFTPGTLTQKLDGAPAAALMESFGSRFGACSGAPFTPGVISANGAACGIVGVCTTSTYGNYQFEVSGTDANGRPASFSSPVLQFGPR
jgi:hypothetical protein